MKALLDFDTFNKWFSDETINIYGVDYPAPICSTDLEKRYYNDFILNDDDGKEEYRSLLKNKIDPTYIKDLTLFELHSIRYYTSANYDGINKFLENRPVDDVDYTDFIAMFDNALKKTPVITGTFYRAETYKDFDSYIENNDVIFYYRYLSTTTNKMIMKQRKYLLKSIKANKKKDICLLKIETNKAHDIHNLSAFPNEEEYIIERNTHYHVEKADDVDYKFIDIGL